MKRYDYIIIGSGLGGLGAAGVLVKNGMDILVVEKNGVPGGRCSSYKKRGFTVDYGTHIITRSEYGPIGEIVELLEMGGRLRFYHLRRMPAYILEKDRVYGPFGLDIDQKNTLSIPYSGIDFKRLGARKEDFDNIFKKMSKLVQNVSIKKTRELDKVSFQEYMKELDIGKGVLQILYFLYMAGVCVMPHEGSAGEFLRTLLYVMSSSLKSVWMERDGLSFGYPYGGCSEIPNVISEGIEKFGGVIKYNTMVEEIIIKDNRAIGVRTNKGEILKSDKIISNIGPKETILDLCNDNILDKRYIERIRNLKPSIRSLVLKIALEKPITNEPFQYLLSEDMERALEITLKNEIPEVPIGVFIPVPSIMDPRLAPKGKQLLLPGTVYAPYSDTGMNEERIKEKVLSCMELVFPHIQRYIEWVDIFTPEIAMKLWRNVDGAINRIGQTVDQVGDLQLDYSTPIENLYLVGTGIGKGISGVGTEFAITSGMSLGNLLLNQK
ncbi:MAG: phytoene desaturase family protein [Candidatus Helarchaeota archaeon]